MKPTILIIEDDPNAVKLAEAILGREEYRILTATNGFQGLKVARADSPDLILLDLMLPGLDGFEVLSQLRADPQTADLPVIVLSAKAQPADRQMADRVGADAYQTKPYIPNELRALIRSLLNARPEKATPRGTCVILVAPQGGEAATVTLYVGLALAGKGETVTVVDFRPFSVAHSLFLSVSPHPAPIVLSDPETTSQLDALMGQHPSGLRLLNNLEGRGEAGQLTPEDVDEVLDVLLVEESFVLAEVPLYPADVLHRVASRCARAILVTRGDAASLVAARSALMLVQRAGVDAARTDVVLVGPVAEERLPELGWPVLLTLPAEADPEAPGFHTLAGHLQGSM